MFSQRQSITQKGVHTHLLTAREREHWLLRHFSHFFSREFRLSIERTPFCAILWRWLKDRRERGKNSEKSEKNSMTNPTHRTQNRRSVCHENSRRLWQSPRSKFRSVPESGANFPGAFFGSFPRISGKEKAHKHKQIFPVTARVGGVSRTGGPGAPDRWPGSGYPAGRIGFPAGRIGDRGDREIVYVPNVYVPFPAPSNFQTALTLQPSLFWEKKNKGNPEKSKGFSLRGTPKILGKEKKKTHKKGREI